MKLKIKSDKIIPLFDTYKEFVDEAVVSITEKGLESIASDRAMVCIFSISIPKERFEHFEVEKPVDLGLNIINFVDMLKRAGKDESIILEYQEIFQRLRIRIDSRTFTTALLDISREEVPDISQLSVKSSFRIKSEILRTAVDDSYLNSDTTWFETNTDRLKFYATGDIANNELEVDKDKILSIKGIAKAQYPIDYLKKLKLSSDEVFVEFDNDSPCKISFLDGFFVLAPRVMEDGEEEVEKEEKEIKEDEEIEQESEDIT